MDNSGDTCRIIDEFSKQLYLLRTNQEFGHAVQQAMTKTVPEITRFVLFNYNWHSKEFEAIADGSLNYENIPASFHQDMQALYDQSHAEEVSIYEGSVTSDARPAILQALNTTATGRETLLSVNPVNDKSGLFYAYTDREEGIGKGAISLCSLIANMALRAWKNLNFQALQIREYKKTEKRFVNQQQFMREIFDYVPVHIFTKDPDGNYVFLNKNLEAITGQLTMDALGKQSSDLFGAALGQQLDALDREVWQSRKTKASSLEVTIGQEKRHLYTSRKVINTSENKQLLLGFAVDITDTVEARRNMEEQRQFFEQIIDTVPNYIYVKDDSNNFLLVNQAVADLFQATKEEVVAQGAALVQNHPVHINLDAATDNEVINTRKGMSYEETMTLADGEVRWMQTTKQPLPDKDGKVNVLGISVDITEIKRQSEELMRTKKAKEQFLANMSHEIRTPINGIVGMINLLESTPVSQEQRKFIHAIKKSSDNLKVIINDILDISVIESGNLRLERIGFQPKAICQTLIESFRYLAQSKDIQLTLNYDPFIDNVLIGDPVRLNQILLNLLGNAMKFTTEGFVRMYALKLAERDGLAEMQFIIQDSGIGIEESRLQTIFESFEQGNESISRKYGGTGLGLSIVKQLVAMLGGSISVVSEVARGTTFRIDIAYEIGSEQHLEPGQQQHTGEETPFDLSGKNILLVEDNEVNLLYVKKVLEKWNARVDTALNGLQSLEKLKNSDYDLILMDVQMPVMDGYEATQFIRSKFRPPKSKTKIVAITANAIKGDDQKCLDAGMDGYLSKPFKPADLKEVISVQLHPKAAQKIPPAGNAQGNKAGVVNLHYLKEISDNDRAFMLDMIGSFIDQNPGDIEKLKSAIARKDWEEVAYVAHKIKPSISFMGIDILKSVVLDIERYAKKHEGDAIPRLVEKLENICQKAYQELKHEQAKLQ